MNASIASISSWMHFASGDFGSVAFIAASASAAAAACARLASLVALGDTAPLAKPVLIDRLMA